MPLLVNPNNAATIYFLFFNTQTTFYWVVVALRFACSLVRFDVLSSFLFEIFIWLMYLACHIWGVHMHASMYVFVCMQLLSWSFSCCCLLAVGFYCRCFCYCLSLPPPSTRCCGAVTYELWFINAAWVNGIDYWVFYHYNYNYVDSLEWQLTKQTQTEAPRNNWAMVGSSSCCHS